MASVKENLEKWNSYEWPQSGDEWSDAWGGSEQVWARILFPRIGRFLPTRSVLEIAPGFGRWTRYLQQFCESYIGADISEKCIDVCRRNFPSLEFHQTDGMSVPTVKNSSISFCFSYDSLVHANSETIRSYISELARVLKPDGIAFLHHSNLGAYKQVVSAKQTLAKLVPSWRARKMLRLSPETHWRDPDMTADLLREFCFTHGLSCAQELISWIDTDGLMIDCLTVVTRSPMKYRRTENPMFGTLAPEMRCCFEHYRYMPCSSGASLSQAAGR